MGRKIFISLSRLCIIKIYTINQKKSIEWEKILIMNITNKGLVSEIFKYNKTKAKQTSRRMGEGYEQEIHRRGTCIVKNK